MHEKLQYVENKIDIHIVVIYTYIKEKIANDRNNCKSQTKLFNFFLTHFHKVHLNKRFAYPL